MSELPAKKPVRSGVLSLTIRDKVVLYSAYMPFIKHGGLFIPTSKQYEIGDDVFMLLNIMDESEKIPVSGKVVWVTPQGAQGNRACGIGVQFSEEEGPTVRNKIDTYLIGALNSDKTTHTL
jgi:type IV pilus assembly protein PilZ